MYSLKIHKGVFFLLLILFSSLSNAINIESEDSRSSIKKAIKKGVIHWSKQQYDSAAYYLKSAEINAEQVQDTQLLVACYNNQGLLYLAEGEYDLGIKIYKKSLSICSDSIYAKSKLLALLNIGIIYKRTGNYEEAFKWLIKTQEFAESFPVGLELASCYNQIGIIKEEQSMYNDALVYHKRSLKIRRELGYKKGIIGSLNNLASVYKKQGYYKKSLKYYRESLELAKQLKNREYLAYLYHNIGDLEKKTKEYVLCRENTLEALRLREEIEDDYGVVDSKILLGELNTLEKKYSQAETYLLSAKEMVGKIKALDLERDIYLQLKNLYAAQNKGKEALAYYDKYISIKDSIFNTENMQHMQEMETRYQTREKEQQIEVLNIEKEAKANESFYMKIVLGVFLFSLLPIGFFVKQRQKTRILKERVAASNRECTKLGMELHDSISGSLTYLCRSMEKESVGESFVDQLRQVSDEVRGISHQLNMTAIANQEFRDALSDSLQLDHFPEDIDLKIYVPDGFEIDDYEKKINLIRIVQELKTNSLKHGNASSIVISFSRLQNKVRLDYSDNGMGFDLKEAKKGNGLINIRERVELLSGKLDWQTSPGNGVSFHLTV